jgi:hypothetical protein
VIANGKLSVGVGRPFGESTIVQLPEAVEVEDVDLAECFFGAAAKLHIASETLARQRLKPRDRRHMSIFHSSFS